MAEKSSFFDSVGGDRAYYAADWALHLSKYFSDGIFNNGLQVLANEDMSISISAGDANIKGYRYNNDSEKIINIANADGTLNRIDNIVIRLDIPNRQVTTEIVQGAFAENAVAPALVRGTSVFDLRIAKINVPAGTTAITQDLIEDTRYKNSDCGNVICAVQTPDFTNILAEYIAIWEKLINDETVEFEEWFNRMKNQLSEDAAGKLQLEIDSLKVTNHLVTVNETIAENTDYIIPVNYTVGSDDLEIYWEGVLLIKDVNYTEVGTSGESSNIIQFLDWDVDVGESLMFKLKGGE